MVTARRIARCELRPECPAQYVVVYYSCCSTVAALTVVASAISIICRSSVVARVANSDICCCTYRVEKDLQWRLFDNIRSFAILLLQDYLHKAQVNELLIIRPKKIRVLPVAGWRKSRPTDGRRGRNFIFISWHVDDIVQYYTTKTQKNWHTE